MFRYIFAILVSLLFTQAALAQQTVPQKRLNYVSNIDFIGEDLQQLFDTDLASCRRACSADGRCVGFTFNKRSNACFPKKSITGTSDYDGAISARLLATPQDVLARASERVTDLSFLQGYDRSGAYRQASQVGGKHPNTQWSVDALKNAAFDQAAAQNYLKAMRWMGVAVAITDDPQDWLSYGRYFAALKATKSQDQRNNRNQALWAAINSYLRADSKYTRADALGLMATVLEPMGRGRDMIPALKLANALDYRETTASELARARGKYGFRVMSTVVESNSTTPSICADFSEPLDKAENDYARFVALPDPRFAVQASGNRLCVTGVEHGQRYEVNFRSGLPAESGEVLSKDTRQSFYVRDRAPEVRFPGRGYILPLGGDASLPVQTVNLSELSLTLRRVSDRNLLRAFQDDLFAKPLYAYEERKLAQNIGEDIWTGEGLVSNELNQNMTTRLPLGDALKDAPSGIYVMSARAAGNRSARATQWFVISDLGISTASGTDGLHVFLRSLKTASPLEGTTVKVLSRSNRVLGTATTGPAGEVHFSAALTSGQGASAPALVIAEGSDNDMAFLSLTDPAFDLSDRGVSGRQAAGPIDLFLTTERGAYRAGETVYATALARDSSASAVAGLPLTALLMRPDGIEYARQVLTPDSAGGYVAGFPIAASAPRGAWTLEYRAGEKSPNLASSTFLVEDFLPERIDFDIALPDGAIDPTQPVKTEIIAKYLFGAPAAGLKVDGRVSLSSVRELEAYPGYFFGPHDAATVRKTSVLPVSETDDKGISDLSVTLPNLGDVNTPMSATFSVQVSEGSGRPTERRETKRLRPAKPLIGIKPLFEGALPENSEALFDVVVVGPDLAPLNAAARYTVNRVNTRYQWYEQYGNWRWEPIVTRKKISSGSLDMSDGKASIEALVEWGEFEVVVELEGASYATSSTAFTAGWYASTGAVRTPDTLELSLDREDYAVGDEAKLRILPRSDGQALVQVMGDSLISSKVVSLSAGENVIPLTVASTWGTGAYVTVTHISPMNTSESFLPTRAVGLAYAKVAAGDKALSVQIQSLDETQPRQPLNIRVNVGGARAGEQAYLTLAAVDAGILNLTRFTPPDPAKHYFGKRKLGVELRDVYGRLIDASKGELGRLRSGGDAGADTSSENVPPPEELVTFFEGPVKVNADGFADISLNVPAFNGTLRLMAMAWTKTGVGSASKDVIIRDPVVLTASLPRFLSPGDASRMLVEIIHADGPTGETSLEVFADGLQLDLGQIPATINLQQGEKVSYSVPIIAQDTGDFDVTINLKTPDGSVLTKSLKLPVRALDPEVSKTQRLSLAAGKSLTLDDNLLAGFRQSEGRVTLTAGPIAKFDVAGLLTTLDRYPYGCTEQLTSAAMPLLYMSSVSEALGLTQSKDLPKRIEGAITRILTRQSGNGSFGLWYPSSGDVWLDAYVTDFLARASKEGYKVPEAALENALGNLRNIVNAAPDFDEGGGGIAYALYVLAREGKAAVSDLRYYADVKADAFDTPIGSAHLAAALALYGDQPRADAMFGKAALRLAKDTGNKAYRYRRDYGTLKRDTAALMTLATVAKSNAIDVDALATSLTSQSGHRSTQEMVWTLLAVDALAKGGAAQSIALDGAPLTGPPALSLSSGALRLGRSLSNTAEQSTDVTLTTFGIPEVPPEAGGYGYAIERKYFTLEGEALDTPNAKAGDRFVVFLRVTPFEKASARLMINDPLPAGFEIDNPNLLQSGSIGALSWMKPSNAAHTEFRSERFLAAVNGQSGKPVELAYVVRAVTPGRYHHPAATVEDMYRPTYRANTASGEITITE